MTVLIPRTQSKPVAEHHPGRRETRDRHAAQEQAAASLGVPQLTFEGIV
jgi:hypothetical protein